MQNGWPTLQQLESYVRSMNKPAWSVNLQFYGPEETVRANWAAAKRRFAKAIPGAAFQDGLSIALPVTSEVAQNLTVKTALGIPALEIFSFLARSPKTESDPWHGHADLFVMLPRTAQAVHDAARVMWETYRELGQTPFHNPFSRPIAFYSRSYVLAAVVPTWRDAARNAQSRELFARLIDRCAEKGWGSYRTSPAFQDQVVSKYSFNDNALLRFQEKLKDSIDPNGILSPGRYGLWPAPMRRRKA
jgi:4-cresol dehydrogenase (hydroxylating)